MSLVYLVSTSKDGRRCWFVGTDTRLNRFQQPVQYPLFDDENSKQVDLAFALDARDRWRREFGINTEIVLEKYGQPIDQKDSASLPIERPVEHRSQFVQLTGGGVDGKGYFIHFSPERKKWYCRAIDIPSMVAEHRDRETLWADDSPEAVANKIIELWGLNVAVPFEDPAAIARAEAERQQAAQKKVFTPGIRPGDR